MFYVNIVRQDAERSAYVSEYYAAVIWPDLWLENSRGVLQLQARNDVYFQAAVPTAWRLVLRYSLLWRIQEKQLFVLFSFVA